MDIKIKHILGNLERDRTGEKYDPFLGESPRV